MNSEHEQVSARVTIVHEQGSGPITGFTRLEDDFLDEADAASRAIHVWYGDPDGEPDETYRHAAITSIEPATTASKDA